MLWAVASAVSGLKTDGFDGIDISANSEGRVLGWLYRFLDGLSDEVMGVALLVAIITFIVGAIFWALLSIFAKKSGARGFAGWACIVALIVAVILGATIQVLSHFWGVGAGLFSGAGG